MTHSLIQSAWKSTQQQRKQKAAYQHIQGSMSYWRSRHWLTAHLAYQAATAGGRSVLGSTSWLLRCCLIGECNPVQQWIPPSGAAAAAVAAVLQLQQLQQQGQAIRVGYGRRVGLQQLRTITAAAQLQQQATSAGTA
jgi:hypothetical protein